ncbi:hypothetical protein H0486_16570 [Lachnospiraceae bacterium MD1]|uniref:Uncharacterized protein n=1 Tax=Variimorphobacter saccharofermentans TaxID=2755051 RepID=A0A839K3Q0_9FIRM|nr:ABC-three component system middle component 6 [Variimorphobacter saccharofermentans]MBB2184494.1 hypothetical protein [Variimorphobacter saccharofermentans]
MIVDYEKNPKNSLIYTSAIVLSFLKESNGKVDFEELYKYCKSQKIEYSIFILTIDWMFLVGLIKEINDRNEVVLCN